MGRPLRIVLGIFLVLILLAAAAGAFAWWKLSTLKAKLVAGLGESLGAEVQVTSMDIDVFKGELHAAGITLVNQRPAAPWEKGGIAQATVRYHLADLFAASMPVTVEISSWSVLLHSPLRAAEAPPDAGTSPVAAPSPPSGRFRVTHLVAHEGTVDVDFSDDRKISLRGVAFDSTDNGGDVWTTQLQAASIHAGTLDLGASSVQILGTADKLTFSDLRLQCSPGTITGEGEVATGGGHDTKLTVKGVDVPVSMLVALNWQAQVSGLAAINLQYTGNDQGGTSQGTLALTHARISALPWLGKMTALVGLPDISNVELDQATTDFTWQNGLLHLGNLDVRKTDVVRIAGAVDIDAKSQVDGKLRVGLPSTVTAKWPQMQAAVFPVQFQDYNWADVHVTGTPDHLEEDLTPRLVGTGLNQGGQILDQAAQKAGALLQGIMGK